MIMAEFSVNKELLNELVKKIAGKYNFDKNEIDGIFETIRITYV